MTIEPQDATTVSIRAFPPNPPEVRTLQDYQADLIRRFGRVPSWPALAKRENAARTRLNGQSSMARPQKIVDNSPRTLAARAAIVAKGEETRKSIMRVLVKPMTSADVAHVLGRTPQLIHRHLVVLAERGAVVGGKVKRVMIWERRREAAE